MFAVLFVSAQSTSPRFGILKNQDNTGRTFTYKLVTVTDAAGSDTVYVNTNASETIYKVASLDSVCFKVKSVATSYFNDKITIIAQATAGNPTIKFSSLPGLFIVGAKATLPSGNRRAVIRLVFDGAKWVEYSRSLL